MLSDQNLLLEKSYLKPYLDSVDETEGTLLGTGVGNDGGLFIKDSPEAGEAGELEAGEDSTICNLLLFPPLSLSSLHSELGEAEEEG